MLAGRFLKGLWLFLLMSAGTAAITLLAPQYSPWSIVHTVRQCVTQGCTVGQADLIAGGIFVGQIVLWIYGLTDAARSVHRWNRKHGWTH
jgi:hypothetical protein